jgi:hypothetical protein
MTGRSYGEKRLHWKRRPFSKTTRTASTSFRGVNGINKMLGYKELEILTPQSWLLEDDNG